MRIQLQQLQEDISSNVKLKNGCMVDTNVLLAATYESDPYNEWADLLFDLLKKNQVPTFTNLNVRSEYIELSRRILMAEGLMDFLYAWRGDMSRDLESKLKHIQNGIRKAEVSQRLYRLSDADIKLVRKLFNLGASAGENPSWTWFCERHFRPYIVPVWEKTIAALKVQFLGTRAIDSREHFHGDPTWEDMTAIIGSSGIGSADAMIVNLFLKSKLPMIATADSDVSDVIVEMAPPQKYVISPI